MIRTIFVHIAFGAALSVWAYLAVAFVQWNLFWPANLPSYSEVEMLEMLGLAVALSALIHGVVALIILARKSA